MRQLCFGGAKFCLELLQPSFESIALRGKGLNSLPSFFCKSPCAIKVRSEACYFLLCLI